MPICSKDVKGCYNPTYAVRIFYQWPVQQQYLDLLLHGMYIRGPKQKGSMQTSASKCS